MKQYIKDAIRRLLRRGGYEIIWSKEFGRYHLIDLERLLGKNSIETIIDVGAHFGVSAQEFRRQFPEAKVYSLEPTPGTYEILVKTLSKDRMVRTFNTALGDSCGKIRMNRNSAGTTNSILQLSNDSYKYIKGEPVNTIDSCEIEITTLDEFCTQLKLTKIDFLKIDTQGYEMNVLKGAADLLSRKSVRAIFLEMAWAPIYVNQAQFEDIFSFLRSNGYRFVGFYGINRGEDYSLSWCDGLFIA